MIALFVETFPATEGQSYELQRKGQAALATVGKLVRERPIPFQIDCDGRACASLLRQLSTLPITQVSTDPDCGPSKAEQLPQESCVRIALPGNQTTWSGNFWQVTVVGKAWPNSSGWRWDVRYVAVNLYAWVADPAIPDITVPDPVIPIPR